MNLNWKKIYCNALMNRYFLPTPNVGNGEAFFGSVVVVCSPPMFTVWLESIWPGKRRHCACAGIGTAKYTLHERGGPTAAFAPEWLTFFRHSPWLWLVVLCREQWVLANQITTTGWIRQWTFTQLICFLFYCQIIMTIWANIPKNIVTDYTFNNNQNY